MTLGQSTKSAGRKNKNPFVVKSIFVTNGCWWTIGGEIYRSYADRYHTTISSHNQQGRSNTNNNNSNDLTTNGFISTWHGPTRTCVSFAKTNEIIQGLLSPTSTMTEYLSRNGFFRNVIGSSSGSSTTRIFDHDGSFYSIGNEGMVSVWNSPHDLSSGSGNNIPVLRRSLKN